MYSKFDTVIGRQNGYCIILLDRLSRRSQPPLFTQMIADYFAATQNKTFLAEFLPRAEWELSWWRENRTVVVRDARGRNHSLFRYKVFESCRTKCSNRPNSGDDRLSPTRELSGGLSAGPPSGQPDVLLVLHRQRLRVRPGLQLPLVPLGHEAERDEQDGDRHQQSGTGGPERVHGMELQDPGRTLWETVGGSEVRDD